MASSPATGQGLKSAAFRQTAAAVLSTWRAPPRDGSATSEEEKLVEAGHRTGRTDMTGSVARAIGDHLAAGSAAISAAGAKIARLTSRAGSALSWNQAPARSASAGRDAELAASTEPITPPRSRADWHDLAGRIPQPRAATS